MFLAQQLPPNVYWYDAVQVVLLVGCILGIIGLFNRSSEHGDRILTLETEKKSDDKEVTKLTTQVEQLRQEFKVLEKTVTNHYSHRFEQVAEALGIEWKDED